jgi:hypothetical protein
MTAMPNEIVAKLVEKEAAMKRENRLALEALLFAKKGGKVGNGSNDSKAGRGGKSPRRYGRDNKNDGKEEDLRKCFHCQPQRHITKNCLSKQQGDPPNAADTAAKASTAALATSTRKMAIENYWIVYCSRVASSDLLIDCGCTTDISGCHSLFITYRAYPPNTEMVQGYNGVTTFASRYGNIRLICKLPDGQMEMIKLQEVVHLLGSFNHISQCQIMDNDDKVQPVNHYSLNLYNGHGKLISTAPQINVLFILD